MRKVSELIWARLAMVCVVALLVVSAVLDIDY